MSEESPPPIEPRTETEVAAAALVDSADAITTLGWHRRLLSHIPPGQFLRYLCVGGFNTLFGYTTFAVINYFLQRRNVPASYLFASAISNFINITVAYFGYKLFVFRTSGNYLREWAKAMAVYWSGFLPSLILLPLLVRLASHWLPPELTVFHFAMSGKQAAPYVANAFLMAFGVVYSFIGHKNVTFRQHDA